MNSSCVGQNSRFTSDVAPFQHTINAFTSPTIRPRRETRCVNCGRQSVALFLQPAHFRCKRSIIKSWPAAEAI